MKISNVQLCLAAIFGVVQIWAQETDILDVLSALEEEQTTPKDFGDSLQLPDSAVTLNCRLSCGLTDYHRTCGCVKNRCCLWKNPCVALCNGARIIGDKEDRECRDLSVQVVSHTPKTDLPTTLSTPRPQMNYTVSKNVTECKTVNYQTNLEAEIVPVVYCKEGDFHKDAGCLKLVGVDTARRRSVVIRGCGQLPEAKTCDALRKLAGVKSVEIKFCSVCNISLCNIANCRYSSISFLFVLVRLICTKYIMYAAEWSFMVPLGITMCSFKVPLGIALRRTQT
ncbi:hypothetical protein GE061_007997 [Apolygus lucorum]|uniref:Chitin-binding type-2 domain-containing protein n=1 Tax=Apolygus lucorum TaxID=248454 RepID=A0A8S9WMG9_APOLU|nr:hypothetical protein GE061_007997 [Apolygus lucorum]